VRDGGNRSRPHVSILISPAQGATLFLLPCSFFSGEPSGSLSLPFRHRPYTIDGCYSCFFIPPLVSDFFHFPIDRLDGSGYARKPRLLGHTPIAQRWRTVKGFYKILQLTIPT
jgi:hypothetical protein